MANADISLPKPFASGNVHEWFVRFDICSDANRWNDDARAVKLPTLLEGEAVASWMELSAETKKTYAKAKEEILAAKTSIRSVQRPGEVQAEVNGSRQSAASVCARY